MVEAISSPTYEHFRSPAECQNVCCSGSC